eukprot:COSAG02_NODE_1805_length_10872_cov_7.969461_11_plen_64_part_00
MAGGGLERWETQDGQRGGDCWGHWAAGCAALRCAALLWLGGSRLGFFLLWLRLLLLRRRWFWR